MNIAALTSYYYRRQAYSEEAQAFFTAAEITDSSEKTAVNDMVVAFKAAGLWDKAKAIYPFIGGTAAKHKWNLKDPRDLDAAFRITWNGTITHSATLGVKSDGTTGYGNTHLPISGTLAYNNLNISTYSRTSGAAHDFGFDIGTIKTNHTKISPKYNATGGMFQNGPSFYVEPLSVYGDTEGFFTVNTQSSTLTQTFRNGYIFNSFTSAITDDANTLPFFIAAANSSTGATNYSNRQIAFAWIGDKLTPYEEFLKYTIIRQYINARNGNSAYSNNILFHTIQPASIAQTTVTMKVNSGKTVYVDWGEGAVATLVGDGSNQSVTSAYTTASKTSYGRIYGDVQDIILFSVVSTSTLYGLNINDFKRISIPLYYLSIKGRSVGLDITELPLGLTQLTIDANINGIGSLSDLPEYLQLLSLSGTNSFTSGGLASLPAELVSLYLSTWVNDAISLNSLPTQLTYCVFNFCNTLTGSLKNISLDDTHETNASYIEIKSCGTGVNISTGPMKAWKNTNFVLTSGYSTASVDGFLNSYASVAETNGTLANTINLAGVGAGIANSARSSASDGAVTTLTGLSKTVTTN